MSDAAKSYWLLIVEDDPNHVMLMEAVFSGCDGHVHISVTRSAEEAMSYLQGSWPDADYGRAKMPDVIVLDIGMPGIGGCGFLEWYSRQPRFAKIPVVVFTSKVLRTLPRDAFRSVPMSSKKNRVTSVSLCPSSTRFWAARPELIPVPIRPRPEGGPPPSM